MSQTSYNGDQAVGFAGQLAEAANDYIRSMVNGEAAATPFGIAVKRGSGTDEYALPTAVTDELVGVLVHSHAYNQYALTGDDGVPVDGTCGALAEGPIWVEVEETVALTDPVYIRVANGVADATKTQKGAFRKSADSATAK